MCRPAVDGEGESGGTLVMVSVNTATKLATTVTGAFIVTFCGVVVPLNPLENPLKR